MHKHFAEFATAIARATGTPYAFMLCVFAVLMWAATGPAFQFSEGWQLVINTGTTIVTFLMVFLIQNSQNRDTQALQMKLDELIRATREADNHLIDIEAMSPREVKLLHERYRSLADAEREGVAMESHVD